MRNIRSRITIFKKNKSKVTNKNNNSNINENECLICLEVKNDNNENPIKLNDLASCEKLCTCNGWFHKSCLDSWFIIKLTCPICRNSITSFKPQQIHYYVQNQVQVQNQGRIIQRRLTKHDYLIIFISVMFIYWFYF